MKIELTHFSEIADDTDCGESLAGAEAVVYAAARAQVMQEAFVQSPTASIILLLPTSFFVNKDEDVSTMRLIRRLTILLGVKARFIPIPAAVLTFFVSLTGGGAVARRLLGSLGAIFRKNRELLNWRSPFTLHDGLKAAAAHFRSLA